MGPDHESPGDGELLERAAGGCEASFRALYRRHTTRLYRLALRLSGGRTGDAEEVVQETWRRAMSRASTFEGRSGVGTWLKGIAVHVGLEQIRRVKRDGPDRSRDGDAGEDDRVDGSASTAGRTAVRIDLGRAVADLAPGYRAVLILHDVEGYPHAEIGELLGISPGTSKSQLSRARKQVRSALGEDYARR